MRELNTLLIHPDFFRVFAIRGLLAGNWVVASGADRCFSSVKKSGAAPHPVSHVGVDLVGLKDFSLLLSRISVRDMRTRRSKLRLLSEMWYNREEYQTSISFHFLIYPEKGRKNND